MLEIIDEYCWSKHKKIITQDVHQIPGLKNLTHWSHPFAFDPSPTHYHSDILEIHCMVKGERRTLLKQDSQFNSYTITGNEAFCIFPYELHGNGEQPQQPSEFYALQIDVSREAESILGLNQKYSHILRERLLSMEHRHLQLSSTEIQLIRTGFNLFSSEQKDDIINGCPFLTAFLFNLYYMSPIRKETLRQIDLHIQKAMNYVAANLTSALSVQDLAEISGYSISRFKSKFREEVGFTPADYITVQKMNLAKKLLETTEKNITDLAYELGFSSSNYFSSVFKKITSVSPLTYRRNVNHYRELYGKGKQP